jgi:hypothetical protein
MVMENTSSITKLVMLTTDEVDVLRIMINEELDILEDMISEAGGDPIVNKELYKSIEMIETLLTKIEN